MNKKLFYLSVFLGAILVAGGSKAQAQIDETVDVNVPFQFHAGGSEFPAGAYTIRSLGASSNGEMEIQSADGHKSGLFVTESADVARNAKNSELIFNHDGDGYFLSEIVDPDDDAAAQLIDVDDKGTQKASIDTGDQKHVLAFLH